MKQGHDLMIQCYGGEQGSELILEGFTTYKNANGGILMENRRHPLKNAVIADSSQGVIILRSTFVKP